MARTSRGDVFCLAHDWMWLDAKLLGKGVSFPRTRLRALLPAQEVLRHHETWGFPLTRCHHHCCGQQMVCQSSAVLPKSGWWQSTFPWAGSITWDGGSGGGAWWPQLCAVSPCPCHHLPHLPGSPRCFSRSSVTNAVTVWKQIGCTPSPPGIGCMARRDMLVAGCLCL